MAVVTGANTGLGYESAKAIVAKGGRVLLACRTQSKAESAMQRMQQELKEAQAGPIGSLEFIQLDLSDLDQVKSAAAAIAEKTPKLDLLMLNAGVMVPPLSHSKQGYELQMATNHFGHALLTSRTMPLLKAAPSARIVVVSSSAAQGALSFEFDDYKFEKRSYGTGWLAYAQTKLANQLFTFGLQRRLREAGRDILVTMAHPGYTLTDLQRTSVMAWLAGQIVAMTPAQGALPQLRAAFDPSAEPGAYYGPDGPGQVRGYPAVVSPVSPALDVAVQDRLWDDTERIIGEAIDV